MVVFTLEKKMRDIKKTKSQIQIFRRKKIDYGSGFMDRRRDLRKELF